MNMNNNGSERTVGRFVNGDVGIQTFDESGKREKRRNLGKIKI